MRYELELKAFGDSDTLYGCFQPEILEGDRADIELKKVKGFLLFEVKAKDSIALRAMTNSINKLLTVYEKITKVK